MTCSVEGCTKEKKSRGMCAAHYQNWRRKTPMSIRTEAVNKSCHADHCDEPARKRGLCNKHYQAWRLKQETPEQREKRLAKMLETYRARARQDEIAEENSVAISYLRLKWEQIGQYAAARRFVA